MNLRNLARRALFVAVIATPLGAAGQVQAGVGAAESQGSGTVLATASVATAPRSPKATPRNAAVRLTWSRPSSNGGAKIDKYAVQRRSGATWKTIARPSDLSYRVTNLVNGTTYSFRIRAHNAAGWGAPSTTVSARPRTVPTAPRSLTATSGDDNVTLKWLAPSGSGGAPVGKYAVQWSTTGTSGWKTYAQPSTNTLTTSDFACCQKFFLRVRAHNAAGWSVASNVVGYRPAVPSEPQYPSANAGNQSVDLFWTAPSSNGGASVEYYEVQWAADAGGPWTTDGLPQSTTRAVQGLTNGTTYYFRVRAHNSTGYGPYSSIVSAAPSGVPSAPQSPLALVNGSTVTLTWSKPAYEGGSPIQKYNVSTSLSFNGSFTPVGSTVGPTTTYVVNNAARGKTHLFTIKAQNQFGEGSYALVGATVPATVPDQVTVCKVTYPGGWDGVLRVTWDPPSSDGGEPILFYKVTAFVENDPSVLTTTYVWSPSTTVDVDRLNDSYNAIVITPYNKIGPGLPCSMSNA
jgi:titin